MNTLGIPLDLGASADKSRLAQWVAGLLRALHESRRRQGEREIRRYRHLICETDTHADLKILRRSCRSDRSFG